MICTFKIFVISNKIKYTISQDKKAIMFTKFKQKYEIIIKELESEIRDIESKILELEFNAELAKNQVVAAVDNNNFSVDLNFNLKYNLESHSTPQLTSTLKNPNPKIEVENMSNGNLKPLEKSTNTVLTTLSTVLDTKTSFTNRSNQDFKNPTDNTLDIKPKGQLSNDDLSDALAGEKSFNTSIRSKIKPIHKNKENSSQISYSINQSATSLIEQRAKDISDALNKFDETSL